MPVSDIKLEQSLQRPQSTNEVDTMKEGTEVKHFFCIYKNSFRLGVVFGEMN